MKKLLYLGISTSILLSSCGGGADTKVNEDLTGGGADAATETSAEPKTSVAVEEPAAEVLDLAGKSVMTLRPRNSVYDKPGQDKKHGAKWVANVDFGVVLKHLGDTAIRVGSDGRSRDYHKVKILGGKEGWMQSWFIEIDVKRAVVVKDITLYATPDIAAVSTNKIPAGSIVAIKTVEEDMGDFVNIIGYNGKQKGWIQGSSGLSSEAADVKAGFFMKKVMDAKTTETKLTAVNAAIEDTDVSGSKLIDALMEMKVNIEEDDAEEAIEEPVDVEEE